MGLGATNIHFFFLSFCDSDINWIITNQIGACNHLGTWCALLCIHLFTRPYNIHAAQTASSAGVKKILFWRYNLLRKIQASKRLNQICAELNYFCDFQLIENMQKKKVHWGGNEIIKGVLIPIILSWPIAAQTTVILLKNRSQKAENAFSVITSSVYISCR
jgi:hypothetical protein